eukprot:TRINITY_DN17439_c0_g1_i2.p5 TRINITY_DN17439_c0_g1~~TRINITY_DN17439_c0_g1_i2.p5  ORF type:complete len:113 (-),score=45.81 TRINITY_DN17439_c0_g1_i2:752-1090(-)
MQRGLVGSEMCIRDRYQRRVHGDKKKRNSMVEKKIPVITEEDRKKEILLDINKKINILELCQAVMKGYFMTIRGTPDREIHLDILYNSIFCTEEKYKKNKRYLLLRIAAKKG